MNHILVPTDFSPTADNAILYAVGLATKLDCELTLFHAHHINLNSMGESSIPARIDEHLIANSEEHALKMMNDTLLMVGNHATSASLKIHTKVVYGYAVDSIEDELSTNQYSMIAMGTKGASGLSEVVWGSITSGVIDKSSFPMVVVPDGAKFDGLKSIVYATNFDQKDVDIIDSLRDFASIFDAEVTVLHVMKKFSESDKAEILMDELQESYWFTPVDKMDFELIKDKSVEHGLLKFAEVNSISMIAVLPQEHSLFEKFFYTSVSKALAHHSKTPLFIIKP